MNCKKIVVIGSESTGKSTLSAALAASLQTAWIPEFARDYLLERNNHYTEEDLHTIAKGQLALEDDSMAKANRFLICDTDLYVMKVWSEHSYGRVHRWTLQQIAEREYDAYILTDIDMPWEDDPLREHGTIEMRNYFYRQYHDIVINSGRPWIKVSGNEQQRLASALEFIRSNFIPQ